ncbi:MAG: DNA polymerase III subunit [Chloroflexota bacterium]
MWDLVGHDKAIARLDRALKAGRIAHFYLITGPARVGKTTLALRLAQALNCAGPAERPCGECRACRRIEAGTHLDVRVIRLEPRPDGGDEGRGRPRSGEKNIGIDQVRQLLHEAALSPGEGRFKVYLVQDAENLSIEAANSLLKLLEEPPPQVVLILTAADANMLLPTIVSRCQPVRLQPVPADVIALHLQTRYGVETGRAAVLARIAAGRIGWAIAAAGDSTQVQERGETLGRLVALAHAGLAERFAVAGDLAADFGHERASVYFGLDLWTTWWRDVLLVQTGAEEMVANADRLDVLRAQANSCRADEAQAFLVRIGVARAQLEQNVNARLALESLLLHIPLGRAD